MADFRTKARIERIYQDIPEARETKKKSSVHLKLVNHGNVHISGGVFVFSDIEAAFDNTSID